MKKFLRRYGLIIALLLATLTAGAQEEPSLFLQEELELLAEEDEEQDWSQELEQYTDLRENPLDLNSITKQQLEQFVFLNDQQIEELLAYLYLHDGMRTLYELQLVKGMDVRTIRLLRPFVCVKERVAGKHPSLKEALKYGRHELLTRLDVPLYERAGYETAYRGPALYHSLRYQFTYKDMLKAGITAEKDAGEPIFGWHNGQGYDFYSPYLYLRTNGRLKTLAIGNYRLGFGQGLVLSTGFQPGKSYSLAASESRAQGIRPHTSTDEYNYRSGIAATVEILPRLELSVFYSRRTLDAIMKDSIITSLQKTGLHRTKREAERRDACTQQLYGGHLDYKGQRLQVGFTGFYYTFDHPYEPSTDKYAKYNLRGQHQYNLSLDYRYRLGRFSLAGEVAKGRKGYATLNRLSYMPTYDYRLMLLHRYYAHDYWAMYARAFSESTTPQNENGWYVAAEATPLSHWRFFASVDMFSFPWWKYRISKASQGIDVLTQTTYTPTQRLSMYLRYRYKRKERDVTGTSGAVTLPIYHHRLRYRLNYEEELLTLRTTVDFNHFRQQGYDAGIGYQVTQAIGYTLPRPALRIQVQGSYFHTDNYDTRVYIYESGLLNSFYTPSFSGRGFRYSLLLRYSVNSHLLLLVKCGQTLYQDRDEIGSGNDLIRDNKKTDLQMQLRLKF